ncbi:unnamed protein product [Mycetohabitans rhizoxinica HKI 454]|uniref:Uncharacterized protein n=1 Tax=Mycetohabitans rhizoxinica (strain DSM 19002 / CIP 109453 / HKI 454) TaxID=882378 RepID=E5AN24_MYCRK|nr:unnamed protein product [Mycetohabitans rhizoxinica HKI 454]
MHVWAAEGRDEADGLHGLIDKRLCQVSHKRLPAHAPVISDNPLLCAAVWRHRTAPFVVFSHAVFLRMAMACSAMSREA